MDVFPSQDANVLLKLANAERIANVVTTALAEAIVPANKFAKMNFIALFKAKIDIKQAILYLSS